MEEMSELRLGVRIPDGGGDKGLSVIGDQGILSGPVFQKTEGMGTNAILL